MIGGDQCRVRVRAGVDSGGAEFTVPRGDLLLLSALEQGINYPHSCRVGTCGRCRTRLLSGRISPQVDFALSPLTNRELADGYVLACQAKVRTDIEIDVTLIPHDVVLPRTVGATVSSWRRLPGEVVDLRLSLDEPLPFEAGQYAALAPAGSFVRRSFSIYDVPDGAASEIGFLVRRLAGGRFSEWLWADDRTGARIWVEAPFGQMGLDDEPRDALCVAGGTGIAPVLAIAGDRLRRFPDRGVTILFGVRRSDELFALDRLDALAASAPGRVTIVSIVSHEAPDSGWTGRRGLVTEALAPELGLDLTGVSAFVCGALPMVEAVETRLVKLGVPHRRIHADKFAPSGS